MKAIEAMRKNAQARERKQEHQRCKSAQRAHPLARDIAAAAESFAAACKDAGIGAEVNLRQPGTVLCLEIVPVGSQAIAAVGIVESNACILKPKLSMKLLQLQIPN